MMLALLCSLTKTCLHWPHQKTHRMTDRTHIHQPRRKMTRQNACDDGISRRVTSGRQYTRLIHVDQKDMIHEFNRNIILLQQFLPVIRQTSSEFFIFQQDNASGTRRLRQSISPQTKPLPIVEQF